jgi:hypothetical protein
LTVFCPRFLGAALLITVEGVPVPAKPTQEALHAQGEALVRLLRTVLDEARGLLAAAPIGESTAALEETIARLQREAESMAPDFPSGKLQNGAASG